MKKENIVTEEQIAGWKKEYGHVYKTTVGRDYIIWRKLRRKEYVEAMTVEIENEDQKIFERQFMVVKAAALYPENVEALLEESGGLATTLADEIMLKSGFDTSETEEL